MAKNEKWVVGQPGGVIGPFYSVVSSRGEVIAMQVPSEERAEQIALLGTYLAYDFDTIQEAKVRLRKLFEHDRVDVPEGIDNYIIRSAIFAMFNPDQVTEYLNVPVEKENV